VDEAGELDGSGGAGGSAQAEETGELDGPGGAGDSAQVDEAGELGGSGGAGGSAQVDEAGELGGSGGAGGSAQAEETGELGEAGSPDDSQADGTGELGDADADEDSAQSGAVDEPAPSKSRLARHSRAGASRLARHSRAAAARVPASGSGFSRLTLLPALLVIAWLLPAVPLLLAGSFALAPMLVISIPVALALIVFGLRRVPGRWPMSAQTRPGLGRPAPWWSLLATAAVAAGFTAWQIVMNSQQVIVTRDPGIYLQFGYWIAQHGSTAIPVSAAAFGGAHPGLSFGSVGFVQHGATLSPQFLAGLPSVLAAGFWAGGIKAGLLVPPVLGGLAVLTFGGLVGRLAGSRWAPAGAIVLALALPQQYTSRSAFSETLTQILLFGGLCLLIDSLCAPPAAPASPTTKWWRASPSPATVLAALGGLALGLTAVIRVDGLSDLLPAIPLIGIMFAARKPQWLPFGIGLIVGAGYGLADGYLLARPYLDSLASWMRPFGIIAGAVTVVTLDCVLVWRYARLDRKIKRLLAARPLRWLPELAAGLTVLALIGFAIRPYVQTVRGDGNRAMIAYVGYLQRVAGLPLDPRRLYAEDTLYWVIWYIGLPALLLGVFGIALLIRRVVRALITWSDPAGTARLWVLPLLIIGWATVTVLWRPGTVPDQPWASRRLVPVVLPGLILAAVWAAAWLTDRAGQRGAGKVVSSAVVALCVAAILLPTALTTFGIGVAPSQRAKVKSSATGLALQRTSRGETSAVGRLCSAIGPSASVVIVDPRVANEFTQLIRGMCDVPVARMNRPSAFGVQAVVTGIEGARRRPVLLGADQAELAAYGPLPREILNLVTTQDAHELTRPPTTTWPAHYVIWMSQLG
jgi:hypothetical protein